MLAQGRKWRLWLRARKLPLICRWPAPLAMTAPPRSCAPPWLAPRHAQEGRYENALGAEFCLGLPHGDGGGAHLGDQHGIGLRRKLIDVAHDRRPRKALRRDVGVNDRRDGKTAVQRADRRDLGKIGSPDERDARITALARGCKRG